MSPQLLPSGNWRASPVWHEGKRHNPGEILGYKGKSYRTKRDARRVEAKALDVLEAGAGRADALTVAEFHGRWTTDPLFARPKESTNIHNRRAHARVCSALRRGAHPRAWHVAAATR